MPYNDDKTRVGAIDAPKEKAERKLGDLSFTKTLFVHKLTTEPDYEIQEPKKCSNLREVFETFQPKIEVDFENGPAENFTFKSMDDFSLSKLTQKSQFLQEKENSIKQLAALKQKINTNRLLRDIINNPDLHQAFVALLQELKNDLD